MAARKPENTFRDSVHRHLPRHVYQVKMNNPYVGGIPDDWYSGDKADLWIEYKWLPKKPTKAVSLVSGTKPMLSKLQQEWLRDRHAEGRNVAVIVGCPAGAVILRHMDWESTWSSDFVLTRRDVADWITGETCNVDSTSGNSSKGHNTDLQARSNKPAARPSRVGGV